VTWTPSPEEEYVSLVESAFIIHPKKDVGAGLDIKCHSGQKDKCRVECLADPNCMGYNLIIGTSSKPYLPGEKISTMFGGRGGCCTKRKLWGRKGTSYSRLMEKK
jgi:hypothetical protein